MPYNHGEDRKTESIVIIKQTSDNNSDDKSDNQRPRVEEPIVQMIREVLVRAAGLDWTDQFWVRISAEKASMFTML